MGISIVNQNRFPDVPVNSPERVALNQKTRLQITGMSVSLPTIIVVCVK